MKQKPMYRILALFIGSLFLLSACQESFDHRLAREAREFTQNSCPYEPEPGTRLDSVAYDIKTRTYTFYYSLAAINSEIMETNSPLLHRLLLRKLTASAEMKALKDERVTFAYVYRSQGTGKVVYTTLITASEYADQPVTD